MVTAGVYAQCEMNAFSRRCLILDVCPRHTTPLMLAKAQKNSDSCSMTELLQRISVNPKQCGGRPCVRGMRIRVSDVLDLYVSGLDSREILDEMPDLEADDLRACLLYARLRTDHPVLAA